MDSNSILEERHRALLRLARSGDREAMGQLWAHHERALHGFLRRGIGVRPGVVDVEDLLQEVFLRAWSGLAGLRGEEPWSMRAWLRRIARNCLLDALGHPGHAARSTIEIAPRGRPSLRVDGELVLPALETSRSAEALAEARERGRVLRQRLATLAERERFALMLHDWLGVPWETVAFVLDCPSKGAAQSLHARARRRLGARMKPGG